MPLVSFKIIRSMKVKFLSFLLVLFVTGTLVSQPKTLKFDMKYRIDKIDNVVVSDSLHHKMGLASGTGVALLSDGSSATVSIYFIYDYTGGNGSFTEYDILTFPDGSTLTVQAIGQTMGSFQGKDPLFSATVSVIGGTGKYDGYSGDGSMTGNRQEALKDGATVKLSFTVNLK